MSKTPRHILLIARHYPPLISGGCRRTALLVKGLREHGMRVSIIAPALNEEELKNGFVVSHPQAEPNLDTDNSTRFSMRDFLRNWLLYPDADIRWSKRAVKAAVTHYSDSVDWVITSSPPESAHAAGLDIKRKTGCFWHADMRDFWLEFPLLPIRRRKIRQIIELRIAKRLLSQADLVTAVSPGMAREVKRFSGKQAKLLENFVMSAPAPDRSFFDAFSPGAINLVYTGAFSLSDLNRSIEPVISCFENAAERNDNLAWHIAGPLTDQEQSAIKISKYKNRIFYHGKVEREHARKLQVSADALIITASADTVVVPGKLAEYQSTRRPIIAIGTGSWIEKTGFEGNPVDALAKLTGHEEILPTSELLSPAKAAEKLLSWMSDIEAQNTVKP